MSDDIKTKLNEEHDFTFNKQNVPAKLIPFLTEIEENKRKWKSLYMAVWGLPLYFLKPSLIDKNKGDELMSLGLPAAKLKQVLYTPNELNKYLTSYDHEIHISQLIKLFTLIENYLFEYQEIRNNIHKQKLSHRIMLSILSSSLPKYVSKRFPLIRSKIDKLKSKFSNQRLDFTYFQTLGKYLKENNLIDSKDLLELEFAKETRNSFVHRRGLVNKVWLKAYKNTGRKNPPKLNGTISLHFHDLEDWTDVIIKIVEKSLKNFNS